MLLLFLLLLLASSNTSYIVTHMRVLTETKYASFSVSSIDVLGSNVSTFPFISPSQPHAERHCYSSLTAFEVSGQLELCHAIKDTGSFTWKLARA
ncbi:hypothetical protein F5Y07DRAFT_377357 [Xylaria sp. FL0933]|nr:hypothetical protein F5Y07DRAFT_377357 [Xylaria sp. FL0933]